MNISFLLQYSHKLVAQIRHPIWHAIPQSTRNYQTFIKYSSSNLSCNTSSSWFSYYFLTIIYHWNHYFLLSITCTIARMFNCCQSQWVSEARSWPPRIPGFFIGPRCPWLFIVWVPLGLLANIYIPIPIPIVLSEWVKPAAGLLEFQDCRQGWALLLDSFS